MKPDLSMASWQLFTYPRFQLHFRYPAITPKGHVIDMEESENDDATRVHLISRDSQEVYFEVRRYRDLPPEDEYQRHKADLEKRFESEGFTITELTDHLIGTVAAWQYSFRWDAKQRVVILIQLDGSTYRIIYDPLSSINPKILSTIELIA